MGQSLTLPPPSLCAAPVFAVGKITGKEGLHFEGRALCFDCEEDMIDALAADPNQFRVRLPTLHFVADQSSRTLGPPCVETA